MTALTIAGFDPSSGAGITADLQVFAAHGVFGVSAITALTVQSTMGVRRTEVVQPGTLRDTLETLQADLPPGGVKIGMLGGVAQVREVIRYLRSTEGRVVVLDPVIRSSSGASLLDADGVTLLREELLPLVDVLTPNVAELAILADTDCTSEHDERAAALQLSERYGAVVIVTGGDRRVPEDHVYQQVTRTVLPGEHIATRATHGTGCAFSSSLVCGLMHGLSVIEAARNAKRYVAQAMRTAVPRGTGNGPMNLLWPLIQHP